MTPMLASVVLRERVVDDEPGELAEIAVARPDRPDTMFEHQCDEVRIRDKVAGRRDILRDVDVVPPERFVLAAGVHVG